MTLYLKYRPNTFEEIMGNSDIVDVLKNQLSKTSMPKSLLFHGPTGCGKTTLGRIVANEIGARGTDLREVDSADFRGIDTIREIRKQSAYKPLEGPCRVWILDECHKLTGDAQTALLKALEDTPSHVYYILCTTEPEKLLKTIRGRCSQYQVNLLSDREMFKLLKKVTRAEKEKLSKEIYDVIIQDSMGHPRNALQILDQVLAAAPDKRGRVATHAAEKQSATIELCRALINQKAWKEISGILTGLKKEDPEQIRRAVLGYCQAVLLGTNPNPVAALVMQEFIEPFYNTGFPGLVYACYCVFSEE